MKRRISSNDHLFRHGYLVVKGTGVGYVGSYKGSGV